MLSVLKRLWRNESGQDLVEYVLLMALIALVVVAGIHTLGKSIVKSTAASANTLQAVTASQQGGGGGPQVVAASRVTATTSRATATSMAAATTRPPRLLS